MLALSLRNLCRVGLSLWLVFLAKLLQTPWILQETFNIPSSNKTNELERAESMPIMCTVLSTLDTIMMSLLMFYLAALSLYQRGNNEAVWSELWHSSSERTRLDRSPPPSSSPHAVSPPRPSSPSDAEDSPYDSCTKGNSLCFTP